MRAVAYPAIERHGIIGDRRTAALVSADGVLDWLCLPDYDGHFIFGALLDFGKGGLWRLGPAALAQGEQTYDGETMVLQTEWKLGEGELLLQDAMLWPEDKRAPEQDLCRVIVRCLKCTKGRTRFSFDLRPGFDFADPPEISAEKHSSGWSIRIQDVSLRLWCNRELQSDASGFWCDGELNECEEIWTVLEFGAGGHGWTVESAREALEKNRNYWRDWLKQIHSDDLWIRRSAITVHLLTYAPHGSVVAAATTSLPERIGGAWNADYRLSWIRDASLAMGMLERLGDWQETERYLEWLHQRQSRFGMPLQVLYGIRGEKRERQTKLKSAAGYRGSVPVRVGNHAYNQYQLGSLGFLADCIWLYLQSGGEWNDKYWKLVRRLADYTCKHWTEPDNGIWELPERQHFVSSRVLCWVALDRAIRIAKKVKSDFDVSEWEAMAPKIHAEIMERGWSEKLGAFKQRYEAENLDAATLLISVLEFLPARHPRVLATIEKVNDFLTIDGYTYRFNPRELPVLGDFPLGQLEAAFLPCTFWLATAYAKAGEVQKAEAVLLCAERVAGRLGIFAEAVDPRTYCFMGNTPLLFSHVEYVRAKMEIARVKGEKEPSAP